MKTVEEIALDVESTASFDELINPIIFASLVAKKYAKQLLEEYTNRIVENAKIEWRGSMVTSNVDKKSIISQLPKFLKELEKENS